MQENNAQIFCESFVIFVEIKKRVPTRSDDRA